MRLCPADCERYTQCFAVVCHDIADGLYMNEFSTFLLGMVSFFLLGLWGWQKVLDFMRKNDFID